jgi:hypothetical protein
LILLGAFILPSMVSKSQQDFWFMELPMSAFAL